MRRAKAYGQRGIAHLHVVEPGCAGGVEPIDAFRYRVSYGPANMAIR